MGCRYLSHIWHKESETKIKQKESSAVKEENEDLNHGHFEKGNDGDRPYESNTGELSMLQRVSWSRCERLKVDRGVYVCV